MPSMIRLLKHINSLINYTRKDKFMSSFEKYTRIEAMQEAMRTLNNRLYYTPVARPYQTIDDEELKIVEKLIKTTFNYAFKMHNSETIDTIIKNCLFRTKVENILNADPKYREFYNNLSETDKTQYINIVRDWFNLDNATPALSFEAEESLIKQAIFMTFDD